MPRKMFSLTTILLFSMTALGADRDNSNLQFGVGVAQSSLATYLISHPIKTLKITPKENSIRLQIEAVDEELADIKRQLAYEESSEITDTREALEKAKIQLATAEGEVVGFESDEKYEGSDYSSKGAALSAKAKKTAEVNIQEKKLARLTETIQTGHADAVLVERQLQLISQRARLNDNLVTEISKDAPGPIRKFRFVRVFFGALMVVDLGTKTYHLVVLDDDNVSVIPLAQLAKDMKNIVNDND